MKLDYQSMIQLVRIRKAQIKDISLEIEKYNTEFTNLEKVEILIAELIVNERVSDEFYENQYKCPYEGTEWAEFADSMCNSRCPNCNKEIEPIESERVTDESNV